MRGAQLREYARAHGPAVTSRKLYELLSKNEVSENELSVRDLWEALIGPVQRTLPAAQSRRGYIDMPLLQMAGVPDKDLREAAVDTTTFSVIIGTLLAKKVIDGYEQPGMIGRSLVTVMPSKHKKETYAGFKAFAGVDTVEEGKDYPETGFGEKHVTSEAAKKGLLISVTEELIMEDQTGQLLRRAGDIGKRMRLEEEKTILKAVMNEVDSYWPGGTATTLYADDNSAIDGQTNDNLQAGNALADWTNIQAAELLLAAMSDEAGEPVLIVPRQILVPTDLGHTVRRIVNATSLVYGKDTESVRTQYANTVADYQVLSSPLVSALQAAGGATNWWLGDFPSQFTLQEIWPIQVLRRGGQKTEAGWKRDVVEQFKTRAYFGVAATDHRYVIKNTA